MSRTSPFRLLQWVALAALFSPVAGAQEPPPADQPTSDQPAPPPAEEPAPPPADSGEEQGQGASKEDESAAASEPAPPPPPPPEASAASTEELSEEDKLLMQMAEEQVKEQEAEVIIVTGSAVERKDLTTPAPVAIVSRQDLDASGLTSVGDVLRKMPSQSNAINTQYNNGGSGATRVSLRGLGSGRTLVLVNGRRHVPGGTGADSSVDLNAIPMAIIDRIEVLKDGASALYGSDAIGGVINIITKTDYDGVAANLYTGSTTRGGGFVYDMSATGGINSDKGNIVFSVGLLDQGSIGAGDRSFSKSDKFFDWETGEVFTNGSTSVPQGYINDRLGSPGNQAWQDIVNAGNGSGIYYNDPVTGWRDFNLGGNSDVGEGDLYNYQPANHLLTPSRRYNAFSAGHYKFIEEKLEAFFELTYMNRRSNQQLAPTPLTIISEGLTLSADSVYNPFGRDFRDVRRRMAEAGNRIFTQDVNTFRLVGGLEGKLPDTLPVLKKWRWNISYNFGRTESSNVNEGRFIRSRVAQAIGPSYYDADGVARCGTEAAPGDADCVPLNLLGGEGTVTEEMLKYIGYTGTANGYNTQQIVEATAAGSLYKIPGGGDVALAIGAAYRDENGGYRPDPITATGDTTGNKEEPTAGGYDVKAAFAELSVIPVKDKPFAEGVELSAAMRAFQFETFGADFTWKTGALWRIAQGVSVRGTYSTAFRAPSIGELFAGTADSFASVTDPCDTSQGARSPTVDANCRADGLPDNYVDDRTQIRSKVGGNPSLDPETAKIFTLGTVWKVPWVEGLSATLDYWNISVDNAIVPQGASVILSNCYAQNSRSDCEKIIRDGSGFITDIIDLQSNIGGSETAGVDLALHYEQAIEDIGRLTYNLEGTWLQKFNEIQPARKVEGKGVYDLGVHPDYRFNFSAMWNRDAYGAGANFRYIDGFRECEDNDCSADNAWRNVDMNMTADLFASYMQKSELGRSMLTVGVNNLTDANPAVIYNGFLGTSDASTYDFMGRFVYMRFSQEY